LALPKLITLRLCVLPRSVIDKYSVSGIESIILVWPLQGITVDRPSTGETVSAGKGLDFHCRGLAATGKLSEGELIRLSDPKINDVRVLDLRFPTSRSQIGSDAVNTDPDYSAAYCILETDVGVEGYGLAFTLGHGTELCVLALEYLARFLQGRNLSSVTDDTVAFSRQLTEDSQFRWLGPEKGVIHLAAAALINAVWDLYARTEGKPLWKLLADFEPERIVRSIDFKYIEDAITPDEALDLLRTRDASQEERLRKLEQHGYPAYTTSAGWFGFSDDKIRRLCRESLSQGWRHFKLKVGGNPTDDLRRARLMRTEIGTHNKLMMDANQKWGVLEAIQRTRELA
jgi:L-fuconate dehydratase